MYFLFLKNDIKTNAITNNTIDERVIIKEIIDEMNEEEKEKLGIIL